jgi:hypothetical protein
MVAASCRNRRIADADVNTAVGHALMVIRTSQSTIGTLMMHTIVGTRSASSQASMPKRPLLIVILTGAQHTGGLTTTRCDLSLRVSRQYGSTRVGSVVAIPSSQH